MLRVILLTSMFCITMVLLGCGASDGGQNVDVSGFDRFTFSRLIDISNCFSSGDLMSMEISGEDDLRQVSYSTLEVSTAAVQECLAVTETSDCLVEGAIQTRPLVDSEVKTVDQMFKQILISRSADERCGAGNIIMCSEDHYVWDGLDTSSDFCQPVHLDNSHDVMLMLEQLRDGPPLVDPTAQQQPLDPVSQILDGLGLDVDLDLNFTPIDILRIEDIVVSDTVLGRNGDFVAVYDQGDLNGVLMQDGSVAVDFAAEMGIALVVVRAPCQKFLSMDARENGIWVEVRATVGEDNDCDFLDLGSVDAILIVLPRTLKPVKVFLNNSEFDQINL